MRNESRLELYGSKSLARCGLAVLLLGSGTSVSPPTIEIDFRKSAHERCPISWLMEETTKALLHAFEMIVVHTGGKNVKSFAGMPIVVGHLSDTYRTAWHVRFTYGMIYADSWFVPMG